MTNLEYLQKFITETYGAICFHNDPVDGYAELADGAKMETLAVYFANAIDLCDTERKERLERAAGRQFYENYVGARGKKLCALSSCIILTRFEKNGKTCGIYLHFPLILGGGVMDIMNYFAGNDISGRKLELPNNVNMPVPSNNGFRLDTGDEVKKVLEEYLLNNGLPIVSERNGFFVKRQNIDFKAEGFWQDVVRVQEIQDERHKALRQAFNSLTENDRRAYDEEMGVYHDIYMRSDGDDSAPQVFTNLQAAEKFFTEIFGAICFYNDPQDGYVVLDGGRKIETLSIYFASKRDCQIKERKERLERAAGDKFYERYVGARGNTVGDLLGGLTLAAYYIGDDPIAVIPYGRSEFSGDISLVIDYFCGRNINKLTADLRYFTKNLPTNCGFNIKKGMPIMDTVDKILLKNRIEPLRAGFNFTLPQEVSMDDCYSEKFNLNIFGAVPENISRIAEMRKKQFLRS